MAVPAKSILDMGGLKITSVGDGTNASDAINLGQLNSNQDALLLKKKARAATTANITLSGTQTVDGVALVANDRCLVKDQTTASQNGLYAVNAGAWNRVSDADAAAEFDDGQVILVTEGNTHADSLWVLTTNPSITLGVTSLTYKRIGRANQAVAGTYGSASQVPVAVLNDDGTISSFTNTNIVIAGTQVASLTNNQVLWASGGVISQNGNFVFTGSALGVGGTPVASAILQADSTVAGFLPPRMTTVQRDAIGSPAAGLVLYNTTSNKLTVRTNTSWLELGGADGNGIYSGSGSVPAGVTVTIDNGITFFTSTTGNAFGVEIGNVAVGGSGDLLVTASSASFYWANPSGNIGKVEANANGVRIDTLGSSANTRIALTDTGTNNILYPARITRLTSGTPTANFGVGKEFEMHNASGVAKVSAQEHVYWTTPTNGSEYVNWKLRLIRNGVLADILTVTAQGDGSILGNFAVSDEAYGASWNGSNNVPTKNAVYDKIETLSAGGGTPGGADTNVQFNNAGAFGGSANFTWNNATSRVTVTGTVVVSGSGSTGTGLLGRDASNVLTGITFTGGSLAISSGNLILSGDSASPSANSYYGTNTSGTKGWMLDPAKVATFSTVSGTTYTIALADIGTTLECTSASATTITIPTNATTAFPIGATLYLSQIGAGQVTISPAGGVTLQSAGSKYKTASQYAKIALEKRGTDTWIMYGATAV